LDAWAERKSRAAASIAARLATRSAPRSSRSLIWTSWIGFLADSKTSLSRPQLRVERVEVGLGVAAEDLDELVAVGEELGDPDLRLGLAQEVLLARAPDDVVVQVAVADVLERGLAAQPLVARRDVDDRVVLAAPPAGGLLSLKYRRSMSE
jgi:hypothetical protein